jgi:2,4-dienoyl-CoA reductase-like NADH-dependent reductase (Old Yellow Enzyme family)
MHVGLYDPAKISEKCQWRCMTNDRAISSAPRSAIEGKAKLFSPFRIEDVELRNRIVMAPMTRGFSPGGVHGPEAAAYYRRRSENGVGLIISEGTWIPHPGAANEDNVPCFHGKEALASWQVVLDEVHRAGGRIMPQLWHAGLMLVPKIDNLFEEESAIRPELCGPSGLGGGVGIELRQITEPMTIRQIESVVEAYGNAALTARDMGFDGVELHGAHGYIIDQFLWERTNRRDDGYGGSIERRARFATEVVAEIRRVTGPGFPIVFRYSQWKVHDYSAKLAQSPQELERMLAPMVDAGVSLFDCSQRRLWEAEFEGSDLNLAGWTKKITGVPTMTVGSVGLNNDLMATLMGESASVVRIDFILEMLARGEFDLLGVGRGLIANPDWPRLVEAEAWDKFDPYTPDLLKTLY